MTAHVTPRIADELAVDKEALATVISTGSGRSYAAGVVAGAGHNLAVLARLAGSLLAKDVDILTDLAGRSAEVVRAATNAITAMNLGNQASTDAP